MSSKETKYGDLLRKKLHSRGARTEKLHGNMFQVGVPDLLVGLPDRRIILVELKWTMEYSITTASVWSMLRPAQKGFIVTWKGGWPVYVCVGGPRGSALWLPGMDPQLPGGKRLEWRTMEEVVVELERG